MDCGGPDTAQTPWQRQVRLRESATNHVDAAVEGLSRGWQLPSQTANTEPNCKDGESHVGGVDKGSGQAVSPRLRKIEGQVDGPLVGVGPRA